MPETITVAIVDDEPPARRRLERLVARHADLRLVGSFAHTLDLREVIDEVDLLLLDIELPHESGFAFLDQLPRERRPQVVVVTAHAANAVPAFRHEAVDFLLKPYDDAGFDAAVQRARQRRQRGTAAASGNAAVPMPTPLGVKVPDGALTRIVALQAIDWIRVDDKQLLVHAEGRTHAVAGRLADYEQRLAPHGFVRVHRGTLVNSRKVSAVRRRAHGDATVVLASGDELAVSRRYAARLDALLL